MARASCVLSRGSELWAVWLSRDTVACRHRAVMNEARQGIMALAAAVKKAR